MRAHGRLNNPDRGCRAGGADESHCGASPGHSDHEVRRRRRGGIMNHPRFISFPVKVFKPAVTNIPTRGTKPREGVGRCYALVMGIGRGRATAEVGLPCDRNCVAGLRSISAAVKRLSASDAPGPRRGDPHMGETLARKCTAARLASKRCSHCAERGAPWCPRANDYGFHPLIFRSSNAVAVAGYACTKGPGLLRYCETMALADQ
jgi:hypothetical protein